MCVLALGWLARQPLLLVDEPFDGLDLRQTRDVGTALCRLAHGGRTLFLSIHQIGDAARVAFLLPFVAMRVVAGDWSVPDFSKGTISPKFKTVGGDADRASASSST